MRDEDSCEASKSKVRSRPCRKNENGAIFLKVTATIDEIHEDPGILDRAIASRERLNILSDGKLAATVIPNPDVLNSDASDEETHRRIEEARKIMAQKFAARDWSFSMSTPLTREERNSRRD
jgi:hypothetical protein